MRFDLVLPLVVTCDRCHASAETYNGLDPDSALACGCCLLPHDHAGLGCRTVTITATAVLSLFSAADLLEAMGAETLPAENGERVPAEEGDR